MVRSRRVLLAAVGLAIAGCISPTLPLPPPSPPEVERVSTDHYRLTGTVPVRSTVIALNQRTHQAVGEDVQELYSIDVVARPGDWFLFWYDTNSEQSSVISFKIPDSVPSGPSDAGTPDASTD